MSESTTINRLYYLFKMFIEWAEGDYYDRKHFATEIWCAEDWLKFKYGWSEDKIKELENTCMYKAIAA